MANLVLDYQRAPAAALHRVWPLAVAAFACPLPTVVLELYLDLSPTLYIYLIPKFTLIAQGCTLIGLLLALEICRQRRWAWGIPALLLNALTLLLTPQFTWATN